MSVETLFSTFANLKHINQTETQKHTLFQEIRKDDTFASKNPLTACLFLKARRKISVPMTLLTGIGPTVVVGGWQIGVFDQIGSPQFLGIPGSVLQIPLKRRYLDPTCSSLYTPILVHHSKRILFQFVAGIVVLDVNIRSGILGYSMASHTMLYMCMYRHVYRHGMIRYVVLSSLQTSCILAI